MTEYEYTTELKKLALEITIQSIKSTAEMDVILDEIIGSHDWVTWFEDAQKVVNISKSVENAYPEVKPFSYSYADLISNLAYACIQIDIQEYINIYKDIAP